ncbi:hypothetical protein SYN65AY6A5_05040 [Synechococcus sp. 65AY6A5]|nr:hypothetical protein SYN65AY6A5_05040 [Synechococcus sp. 65AY6A5]
MEFWGSGVGNLGGKWTDDWPYHNLPYSLELCLPPLSTLVLKWQPPQLAEDSGENKAMLE